MLHVPELELVKEFLGSYKQDVLMREHVRVSDLLAIMLTKLDAAVSPTAGMHSFTSGPLVRDLEKHNASERGQLELLLSIALLAKRLSVLDNKLWGIPLDMGIGEKIKGLRVQLVASNKAE